MKYDLKKAHGFCTGNADSLENDKVCGCFYCLKIFSPAEIVDWIKERNGGNTARCPYCGVDSVIGESSGFPINGEFLSQMRKYRFLESK